MANSTAACSMSGGVRFFRIGFLRLIPCSASSPPLVPLLEPMEAAAVVPIILQAWLNPACPGRVIAERLGRFQQTDHLHSDNLLLLGHIVISVPQRAGRGPSSGENRAATRAPAAILDRLVHNAPRLDLTRDSLRRARPKPAATD
jgi:hypothetical protein